MATNSSPPGPPPHFPSTTSNSHAALFTGAYGNVSNITASNLPRLPRGSHRFTDRGSGFRSDQLAAEPFWVAAARQGKRAVAHQATQAFPFRDINTHPGAVVVNGYQTRSLAPWGAIELSTRAEWQAGPWRFRARIQGSQALIEELTSASRIRVKPAAAESRPPRGRALARRFSAPMFLDHPEHPIAVHFRLLPRQGKWLLLHSPLQELGLHDGDSRNDALVRQLLHAGGATVGNGATALLRRSTLTEAEYLETVELQIRQAVRHARWLDQRFRPDLLQSYLPFPDETDHEWLGRAGPWREWAYVAIDWAATQYARLAGPRDHLLFISDHGMARIDRGVNVNEILKRAGLQHQAVHLYNSLLVNTTEWRDGAVPASERATILARTRAALEQVTDPETGQRVVTAFYTPAEHGELYGIGGPAGADLYFDLLPGYRVIDRPEGQILARFDTPSGSHGFDPLRRDMLAICVGRGPRFPRGSTWPRLRATQIAPLVTSLLGIGPPKHARDPAPSPLRPPAKPR